MRIVDKKLVFSAIETVDFSYLGNVIHTWLVQFKADYLARDHYSVPTELADEHGEKAQEKYIEILDKMIYAFADNEPNIMKYDFTYTATDNHGAETEDGYLVWDMKCTDDEAHAQYVEDCKVHEERCLEGRELFGKYYHCLWW